MSRCLKSAGPAKESKADKRKKEKKGGKGGAYRPGSGKPGKKEFSLSNENNLSAEQGRKQLDQENDVQSTENLDKNKGNEANLAGASEENKENQTIDNETTNKDKANTSDKSTEEASSSEHVNIEENSAGAVNSEGTVMSKVTERTNENSKQIHVTVAKRGKTRATKSRLVLVLHLIG